MPNESARIRKTQRTFYSLKCGDGDNVQNEWVISSNYSYLCTVTSSLKTWTTAIISPNWFERLAKNYPHPNQKLNMIELFVNQATAFPFGTNYPWEITAHLTEIISKMIATLNDGYVIKDGVAIHKTAVIGHNVTIKTPAIISANCFVGSNSYLRNGVFLAPGAKVGISCEVKTSVLLEGSAIAHFNFVGDSIIGQNVNIEAGAVLANHYNEREDDTVFVHIDGQRISTGLHKFGSLVGDGCRIGANAVLSPGTLLKPKTIVKRLELIEQDPL